MNKAAPKGYSTVCPYLMVNDVSAQINFLENVFAAKVKEVHKDDGGVTFQGEVTINEVVLMIGASRPEWPARPATVYVFVENVDNVFQLALQQGAEKIMEPGDREYGFRECGFSDPFQNQWWVSQPLN